MYLIKEKVLNHHTYPRGCCIYHSNELVGREKPGELEVYRVDRGELGESGCAECLRGVNRATQTTKRAPITDLFRDYRGYRVFRQGTKW